MAKDRRIEELNLEIDELKREYDLYLVGQRRTEPLLMRSGLERKVRLLTLANSSSTVFKFRVKTLANRFRSLETQLKSLLERKNSRQAGSEQPQAKKSSSVIIDEIVINNPALVVARVRAMVAELKKNHPDDANFIKLNPDNFCSALVGKAKAMVGKNEVRAVRFQIVKGENGHKVKGEAITAPK
jgi:hypothetical protein